MASTMSRSWTAVWRAKSLQCWLAAKPGCWKRPRSEATCTPTAELLQVVIISVARHVLAFDMRQVQRLQSVS